jgi:hypothetical protein
MITSVNSASVNLERNAVGILVGAVLVNTWLVYSGPGPGEIPGLFPLMAVLIALTPLLGNLVNSTTPGSGARYAVMFGLAWLGLSPANMATLIQPDCWRVLFATAGMIAGLVLYERRPEWRRFGVFLLPVLAAAFSHRVALGFGWLLFAYIFLFEEDGRLSTMMWSLARSLPAFLVTLPAFTLPARPASAWPDEILQGARILFQFIAPWASGSALGQDVAAVAVTFLMGVTVYTSRWRHSRAVSFGLGWFLVMIVADPSQPLPASIGLAIAGASIVARIAALTPWTDWRLLSAGCLCFLLLCGAGTIQANVQAFEGAPALDQAATEPAPAESTKRPPAAEEMLSRSLSSYQAGNYQESITLAQAALQIDPNFADAYNNLAAAHAALRQWDEAIAAAQQALRLQPDFPLARNNLNWAVEQKRLGH